MNRCDVGEEETTNALNALYVIPPPANGIPSVGHPHAASSGPATANTFSINGHAEQSRKRKSFPGDGSALVDSSHPTQASAYSTITQPPPRVRSTADTNHYPSERDSVSKSVDVSTEKKKSKSKNRGSYSDGGSVIVLPLFDTLPSCVLSLYFVFTFIWWQYRRSCGKIQEAFKRKRQERDGLW